MQRSASAELTYLTSKARRYAAGTFLHRHSSRQRDPGIPRHRFPGSGVSTVRALICSFPSFKLLSAHVRSRGAVVQHTHIAERPGIGTFQARGGKEDSNNR